MKKSTIFWIFWLTFVSIHHNQLQCTSAVVVKQQQPQQFQQQQHRTAAISTQIKQHPQRRQQWLSQDTTTKEVIGDVVNIDVDTDDETKANEGKKVEKNNLANTINVQQKRNATKKLQRATKRASRTTKTTTATTSTTTAKSTKLLMQQLLKQHEEKLQKLRDIDGAEASTSQESYETVSVSAEVTEFSKMQNNRKQQQRMENVKQENMIYNLKENLQNLLKSNTSAINFNPEYNYEQEATVTAATVKRAVIMPQPQSTTTTATTRLPETIKTATSLTTLHFITPTSAPPTATTPPSTTASANKEHNQQFHTHSTPVERRHIVPEKLQYTKEIVIKQGRLMGIKRNFQPSSGLHAVDQYLGLPYAEAPVGSRRFMPPGKCIKYWLSAIFVSSQNAQ